MELEERQIPLGPCIIQILGETQKLKSLGVDSKKLKKAKEQYDGISPQLNNCPDLHFLKVKLKKTIIEPQHFSPSYRKIAPDLSEVLEQAWGRQVDFSQEAIKELYVMLETYLHVKQKSRSTSTSGVVSSEDLHSSSTSTSQSVCLSTENIHIVLKQSRKKYKKDFMERVVKEFEQLETYVRQFSNREEMVFISQEQQNEWYEQCLHATKDLLESAPCSKRPLCILLQSEGYNKTPNSARALNEYCSLLHLEVLFNGMEDDKGESRSRKCNKTPMVHVSSMHLNMQDVIKDMEKYFAHDFYENALEEYRELQDIEEKIAKDENLRSRKILWKERSRGRGKKYVYDKTPSRPLHAVLLRAQKEGMVGSESVLMEYESMLHSEVLYESKDALSLEISHNADLEPCWNVSNHATSNSFVYQGIKGSVLESKEFALQEQIDRLQEQMKIRDSEIEGLKARLSQVESMVYNYPEKADLSDINRQTKVRERLEKDAHGLL